MKIELKIKATDSQNRIFLTWAPVEAEAWLSQTDGVIHPITITLRNAGVAGGGRVAFATKRTGDGDPELKLDLPANGEHVRFWVGGEFQAPSKRYGDAVIEAVDASSNSLGKWDLMVRIRKNAVKLDPGERDRFLNALGKLNDAGKGPFQGFRAAHVEESEDEAHGYPGFPPWHRAYLLDLERALQEVDATVALPYWRFDEPAAALFAPEFLGMPPSNPKLGNVIEFPHGHPLETWATDKTRDPIERRPLYKIAGPPPRSATSGVMTQHDTMRWGRGFLSFRRLERAPHGPAHTSFEGPINDVPTAAKDPLFFLLHANVDRLWAYWQWQNKRWDADDPATYTVGPDVRVPNNIGHKPGDTMWPWNGERTAPRPTFAPPRGPFPDSPLVSRPGRTPMIRDMIDYPGVRGGESLGFDYDDVPFQPVEELVA
jgi:tyrosinase